MGGQASLTSAEEAYLFRHAIVREAAYQLQLPRDRAWLHRLAFEALESSVGGRVPGGLPADPMDLPGLPPHPTDAHAEQLAGHLTLSDPGAGSAGIRQIYLVRAALHAERTFRDAAARRLWEEAATLVSPAYRPETLRRAGAAASRSGSRDCLRLLESADLEARQSGNRRLEGNVRKSLADARFLFGLIESAEAAYREALQILAETPDRATEASAFVGLDSLLEQSGQGAPFRQSRLEALGRTGPAEVRPLALGKLAYRHRAQGRFDFSERCFLEVIELCRESGDRRAEGSQVASLGGLYQEMERPDDALRCYSRALELHRAVGDRRSEGITLESLALLHQNWDRLEEAESTHLAALEIHREVGHRHFEGVSLGYLATVYELQGRLEESESAYLEALEIHREVKSRKHEGITLGNLAGLYDKMNRPAEAEATYREALAVHRETSNVRSQGYVLGELAEMLRRQRRFEEAAGMFEEAIRLDVEVSNRRFEAIHRCQLALICLEKGRHDEAVALWKAGAPRWKASDAPGFASGDSEMRSLCAAAGVAALESGSCP